MEDEDIPRSLGALVAAADTMLRAAVVAILSHRSRLSFVFGARARVVGKCNRIDGCIVLLLVSSHESHETRSQEHVCFL